MAQVNTGMNMAAVTAASPVKSKSNLQQEVADFLFEFAIELTKDKTLPELYDDPRFISINRVQRLLRKKIMNSNTPAGNFLRKIMNKTILVDTHYAQCVLTMKSKIVKEVVPKTVLEFLSSILDMNNQVMNKHGLPLSASYRSDWPRNGTVTLLDILKAKVNRLSKTLSRVILVKDTDLYSIKAKKTETARKMRRGAAKVRAPKTSAPRTRAVEVKPVEVKVPEIDVKKLPKVRG